MADQLIDHDCVNAHYPYGREGVVLQMCALIGNNIFFIKYNEIF